METFWQTVFSAEFLYSVFRVTTPILLCALGSVFTSNAGITNLAVEGTMTMAALAGVVVSAFTQSALVGLFGAVAIGVAFSMVFAFCVLKLKTNDIITGIALNLLATGLATFLLFLITGEKGVSIKLASVALPVINIPIIRDIPVLGTILSGHNVLTYLAMLLPFAIAVLLYRTKLGIRIRAVGIDPNTTDSVGIDVFKTQFVAILLCGVCASIGGAYLSMGYMNMFTSNMVAGRGYIAIAAEAMGGGTPFGTALASLVFGAFDALSNVMQSLRIPSELIQCVPYVATIIGFVLFSIRKSRLQSQLLRRR